jgi:hypothetical protein
MRRKYMNLRKKSFLVGICLLTLIVSTLSVSAETIDDEINDIYHLTWIDDQWKATLISDPKPNIDITSLSSSITDGNLTLTLSISGEIQNSSTVAYGILCNTSQAIVTMMYTNGFNMVTSINRTNPLSFGFGNITVSSDGKTIIAIIPVNESDEIIEIYGYAFEYPEGTSVGQN